MPKNEAMKGLLHTTIGPIEELIRPFRSIFRVIGLTMGPEAP